MRFRVTREEGGRALQQVLRGRMQMSLRECRRQLESNSCRLNGQLERFGSRRLEMGDEVEYRPQQLVRVEPDVLFEDEKLLVLNKPAGVTSESLGKPAHRLDRDTTGVLLFPKSGWVRDRLEGEFRERQVRKRYLAIVDGVPEKGGVIRNRLAPIGRYDGQTVWGARAGGREAITHWERLRVLGDRSLVACMPQTGRTHQLRVHLADLGHPILGDGQYGREALSRFRPARTLLHAEQLTIGGQTWEAPLPADFLEAM